MSARTTTLRVCLSTFEYSVLEMGDRFLRASILYPRISNILSFPKVLTFPPSKKREAISNQWNSQVLQAPWSFRPAALEEVLLSTGGAQKLIRARLSKNPKVKIWFLEKINGMGVLEHELPSDGKAVKSRENF